MSEPRAGLPSRRMFLTAGVSAAGAIGAAALGTRAARPAERLATLITTVEPAARTAPQATRYPLLRPLPRWGINYTPSSVWWDLWKSYDPHRVEDDFAAIASLGVDHIRVQLLWNLFQPTAKGGDPRMLDNLASMFDTAAKHKLQVCPSVVTSALSGRKFVPDWANGRDSITEPDLVQAQVRYINDLGTTIGRHPQLLGFDLGNENLGHAPDLSTAHLRTWATRLIHACRLAAPGKLHTVSPNGLFTVPYPEIVSTVGDLSVIHPWCFIGGSVRKGVIAHASAHHAEFNVEHIRSFHAFDPGARRHVWVQEVGSPRINFFDQPVVPASLSADFLEQTIRAILASEDVWGITWWCSHDIDPRKQRNRFNTPEYTLGLFGLSGKPKPMATRLTQLIAETRHGLIPPVAPHPTAVVGSRDDVFDRLQQEGLKPAIVQPDRVNDTAYLARRGITTLVH